MQRRVQPCTCSPQPRLPDPQTNRSTAPDRRSIRFTSLRFHSAPSESAVQRKRNRCRRFAVARAAHDNGRSNPASSAPAPEARKPPPQRHVPSASNPLLPPQRSGSAAQHGVHEPVRTVTFALHCYPMPAHLFASPHQRTAFSSRPSA